MKTSCLLVLLCFAGNAWAMDPVAFIVARNPELAQLEAQTKWFNHISLKAMARGRYGQTLITGVSTDEETLDATGNNARSTYDLTLSATLPLISPKEALDLKLKYLTFMRSLRNEAAAAIARFQSLSTWVHKEEVLILDLRNELSWLQQRADAGLEDTKVVISKTLEIKAHMKELETKRPDVEAAREAVLSFVPESERPRLQQILDGN